MTRTNPTTNLIIMLSASLLAASGLAVAQDGDLDTTFSSDGRAYVAFDVPGSTLFDYAQDVVIQPDGKIVLVGAAARDTNGHEYSTVARLHSNGTLDTSFGTNGKVQFYYGDESQQFSAVALQGTKIVAAGWHRFTDPAQDINYDFHIVRFNPNGSIDGTFGNSGSISVDFDDISPGKWDILEDMVIQPDNKIVLVGRCRATAGDFDVAVARLTADGVLDSTFDGDGRRVFWYDQGWDNHDQGEAVALQPDGRIVIASKTDTSSGNTDWAVQRLEANGSTDCSFGGTCAGVIIPFDYGAPTYELDSPAAIAMMGQKIVIVGTAATASGDDDMAFARLNANGTLDTSFGENASGKRRLAFNAGGDNDDWARSVAVRGDGSIVAAGVVSTHSDADMAFARLTLDGSVDFDFGSYGQTTVAFDWGGDNIDFAAAVVFQDDGKIIAAGRAGAEGSSTDADMAIVRLHQNDVLFADGLETADTEIWSSSSP